MNKIRPLARFGLILALHLSIPARTHAQTIPTNHAQTSTQEQGDPEWARGTLLVPFPELTDSPRQRPTWLVQAKIAKVESMPKWQVVTLTVTKVYAGPSGLGGHKLYILTYINKIQKPLNVSVGQDVISAVRLQREFGEPLPLAVEPPKDAPLGDPANGKQERALIVGYDTYMYLVYDPVILDGSPEAQATILHAQLVQKAYKAAPDKLEALIADYAKQKEGITSLWAIRVLGYWKRPSSLAVLRQLAQQSNRPALQLLTVEDQLMKADKKNWQNSPARASLIRQIYKRPLTAQESLSAFLMLGEIVKLRTSPAGLSGDDVLVLASDFIKNPTTLDRYTPSAIYIPISLLEHGRISLDQAFAFWNSLLNDPALLPDVDIVAKALCTMAPLTTPQQQTLTQTLASLESKLAKLEDTTAKQKLSDAIAQLRTLL